MCRCCIDDPLEVVAVRLALQEQSSRRVPEDVYPRILKGTKEPIGHLLIIHGELRVDRGDDEIELRETVVDQIEPAVSQDVTFEASQQAQVPESSVQAANARSLFERLAFVQAICHGECATVIGDGDVLIASIGRSPSHRFEIVTAVRCGRVHVEVAANVTERNEPGQRPSFCCFDLAAVFAELRLDEVQVQRRVDFGFGRSSDADVIGNPEEPVLVQFVSLLYGPVAQGDVVGLGAREVLHRCAAAVA